MARKLNDFGPAELIDIESIGAPGNRRFRLFARNMDGVTASLWLEREQLEALAVAVAELMSQISGRFILQPEAQAIPSPLPTAPGDFPKEPDIDFTVGQLQLGYDEEEETYLLRATPLEVIERDGELEVREDVEPAFSALLSETQAARLSTHVGSVLGSGRPRCPVCKRPLHPGHLCPKQNGYHPVGLS
jgi:uncharacterized repeat protein (TIGR03847 family)